MVRQAVQSSSIASVGYDPVSRTLEVEFHNGHVYRYDDVPPDIADGLRQATSLGTYFNEVIKKAGYTTWRRVG